MFSSGAGGCLFFHGRWCHAQTWVYCIDIVSIKHISEKQADDESSTWRSPKPPFIFIYLHFLQAFGAFASAEKTILCAIPLLLFFYFSLFICTMLIGKSLGKELDTSKMEILFYSQLEKLP